ncbi:hypothetical protein ACFLS9_05630 [Bacteroidota bacterium]
MWQYIIISEFHYHKNRLFLILILPVIYSLSISIDLPFLNDEHLVSRVFWPLLIGALPIVLIAVSKVLNIKEGRDRTYLVLPLNIRAIVLSRFLFGMIPLIYIILYSIIIYLNVVKDWEIITKRVMYQEGIYAILLSNLAVAFELHLIFEVWSAGRKIILGVVYFLIVAGIIFFTDNALFPVMHQSYIGIIYFIIGVLIFTGSNYLYIKRKTYLL